MDTLEKVVGGAIALIMSGVMALGFYNKADAKLMDERHATMGKCLDEIKADVKGINKSIGAINVTLAEMNGGKDDD